MERKTVAGRKGEGKRERSGRGEGGQERKENQARSSDQSCAALGGLCALTIAVPPPKCPFCPQRRLMLRVSGKAERTHTLPSASCPSRWGCPCLSPRGMECAFTSQLAQHPGPSQVPAQDCWWRNEWKQENCGTARNLPKLVWIQELSCDKEIDFQFGAIITLLITIEIKRS